MRLPTVTKRVEPEVEGCPIQGLRVFRSKVFPDERGFFSEAFNCVEWKAKLGFTETVVQSNISFSKYGVLRGLHSQPGMGKLVTTITGEILDVAVDIRPDSVTFGQSHAVKINANEMKSFYIPSGFLHGFQVLSPEGAHVSYQCTGVVYNAQTEFGVDPFDADLAIDWPISDDRDLIVSARDLALPPLRDCTAVRKPATVCQSVNNVELCADVQL